MSYHEALTAAGAKILAFDKFGSYQGDWIAKVEYDGDVFWLRDYYGSCSGCDAFERDVGYRWNEPEEIYAKRVAEFGRGYLEPSERLTYDEVHKIASEHTAWDSNAEEMVKFVESHR
jgi:hypothetical protein